MAEHGNRSTDAMPQSLARLLSTAGRGDLGAWQAFLDEHSALLMQVARSTNARHDAAMDAYAFLLEQLRDQDFRRLRVYLAQDGSRFSTWLLVVARRLCVDYHRRQYGRPQTLAERSGQASVERATRRRLVDLAADEVDLETIADTGAGTPESGLRSQQLRQALASELEALAPADRVLLAMRFEDGRSAAEIARALGFATPFHVYRRLTHLFEQLRARLQSRGIDDPSP